MYRSRDIRDDIKDLEFIEETDCKDWRSFRERCAHPRKRETVHWAQEYLG
jgi:hypothetical protein